MKRPARTLTVSEFCSRVGVSRSTFYRIRAADPGLRYEKSGRKAQIDETEVKRWRRRREGRILQLTSGSRAGR